MLRFKNTIKRNIFLKKLIIKFFYFLTALLVLGLISEFLVPGLFSLYFNSSFLALLWLLTAIISILYS